MGGFIAYVAGAWHLWHFAFIIAGAVLVVPTVGCAIVASLTQGRGGE